MMFGNLITSRQLEQLRRDNCLYIEPFAQDNLKATHYTLNPGRVLTRNAQGDWDEKFKFSARHPEYDLSGNEYVVVEVKQSVKIQKDGIVGRFVTTSSNVESGVLVVAGQIDSQYGVNNEALRFGVKNLLSVPNVIRLDTRLAHMEFFDLRGITSERHTQTAEEKALWELRRRESRFERADSDGPLHR